MTPLTGGSPAPHKPTPILLHPIRRPPYSASCSEPAVSGEEPGRVVGAELPTDAPSGEQIKERRDGRTVQVIADQVNTQDAARRGQDYAPVAVRAEFSFPSTVAFDVVERVPGGPAKRVLDVLPGGAGPARSGPGAGSGRRSATATEMRPASCAQANGRGVYLAATG